MLPGKGPLKAQFEERVAKLRLRRVAFRTLWLSSEDYPRLLGETRFSFRFLLVGRKSQQSRFFAREFFDSLASLPSRMPSVSD